MKTQWLYYRTLIFIIITLTASTTYFKVIAQGMGTEYNYKSNSKDFETENAYYHITENQDTIVYGKKEFSENIN